MPFDPNQYIQDNSASPTTDMATQSVAPSFDPDQYIANNSDVSPISAIGRGLESTIQPIYTAGAAAVENKPFTQESKEQEALKNAAWAQQPVAYGTGKAAGIAGEAALAPEALEGNITGDFLTNAGISALGADWSDPKNAALETALGGGLGAGIGAAGRGVAEKIASSGEPAGSKAVARLFGIKDSDAAKFAEKFGGDYARLPDVTNANALETMGKGLQDFTEETAGSRVPWSLDKGQMLDSLDKAIQESSDTMNNQVTEVMKDPEVQKITTPVADLSKNITDTDYYKLAPQNAANSPLLKLTNLIDNIPELKGKSDLSLSDLSLLRQKLYSLGDSAWDRKSLNIMKNAVNKESMKMLDRIGTEIPPLAGLKQAVNDEAARYNVLNLAKDKLPAATQPDFTGMGTAGGVGVAAQAAGAPFYVSMLPLMLMRSELRRNLAPILGIGAGKAAEAVMSNPTWMQLFSGAIKKLGPQAGVAAVHSLLSKSDPDYSEMTTPKMANGGVVPEDVKDYVSKALDTVNTTGNMVKGGYAGIGDLLAGNGLEQASQDVQAIENDQNPSTKAGKIGSGFGSFFTPQQIALAATMGPLMEGVQSFVPSEAGIVRLGEEGEDAAENAPKFTEQGQKFYAEAANSKDTPGDHSDIVGQFPNGRWDEDLAAPMKEESANELPEEMTMPFGYQNPLKPRFPSEEAETAYKDSIKARIKPIDDWAKIEFEDSPKKLEIYKRIAHEGETNASRLGERVGISRQAAAAHYNDIISRLKAAFGPK